MIDDAAREIVIDPEKFKNFLDTQSRMYRYSAANALLIYSQYPQATQLKDFEMCIRDRHYPSLHYVISLFLKIVPITPPNIII